MIARWLMPSLLLCAFWLPGSGMAQQGITQSRDHPTSVASPASSTKDNLPRKILELSGNSAGRQEILRLARSDTKINARYEGGLSALLAAAYVGEAEIVKQLLNSGADPTQVDDLDRSALWFATQRRDIESIRLLLASPIRRNFIDRGDRQLGMPPLHMALDRGDTEVVRLLVAAGASENVTDKLGRSSAAICTNVPTTLTKIREACNALRSSNRR